MAGQVGEIEAKRLRVVRFQIGQGEGLEVADEDVARDFRVLQPGQIADGLIPGLDHVGAGRLVLGQQDAGPEQVDAAVAGVRQLDPRLEGGAAATPVAEDLEQLVVEGLRLAPLVGLACPALGECGGARANLTPT